MKAGRNDVASPFEKFVHSVAASKGVHGYIHLKRDSDRRTHEHAQWITLKKHLNLQLNDWNNSEMIAQIDLALRFRRLKLYPCCSACEEDGSARVEQKRDGWSRAMMDTHGFV